MRKLALILGLLWAGPLLAQSDFGFDFRSTAIYVTDPSYAAPVLNETYPHTYTNGASATITAGWESLPSTCANLQTRNRSTSVDPRLAGVVGNSANNTSNSYQCIFKVTLPSTGNWTIALAAGDDGFAHTTNYVQFKDGGTPFQPWTNPLSTATAVFADANGTTESAASWPTGNTTFVHNFTSVTFEVVLGPNAVADSGGSGLAHLRVTPGGNIPIVISPLNPVLTSSGTQTFTATQNGGAVVGGVSWSCPGCSGSINSGTGVYTAPASIPVNQSYAGCQVGPNDSVFNARVDSLPVNSNSAAWIAQASNSGMSYQYFTPLNLDDGTTPTQNIIFQYTTANNGPFVIPVYPNARKEKGWLSPLAAGDHHMEVINHVNCNMQEMYQYYTAGLNVSCPLCTSQGGWKYNGMDYTLPFNGATDAAWMPLIPLSLHVAEMQKALATSGTIKHALRFTLNVGAIKNTNIWPASAFATGVGLIPYGARVRLKSSFVITGFSPTAQILLTQLKQYGAFLADIGTGWAFNVDDDAWPLSYDAAFTEIFYAAIGKSNFEFVDESGIQTSATSSAINTGERVVAASVSVPANTSSTGVALNGITIGMDTPIIWFQAGSAALQLKAYVNGSATTTSTWTMSPTVGTLTSGGLYTPPSTSAGLQTTTVTATAVADGTTSTTMLLNVLPSGIIRLVNGQPSNYTDTNSNVWIAAGGDTTGGRPYNNGGVWPTTPDITLYKIPYYPYIGDLEFHFYVPNGNYSITGKFAATNVNSAGVDSVSLETQGAIVYPNVDYFAAAGGKNLPVDFTLPATVIDGKLNFVLRNTSAVAGSSNPISALQITLIAPLQQPPSLGMFARKE